MLPIATIYIAIASSPPRGVADLNARRVRGTAYSRARFDAARRRSRDARAPSAHVCA